jgi:hypothetical protein
MVVSAENDPGLAEDDFTRLFGSSRSGSICLLRMLLTHPYVMPIDETGPGQLTGFKSWLA